MALSEYDKYALHDKTTQLAGLHRNMMMVIDEIENYYKIEDPEILSDIEDMKMCLNKLDFCTKKLYRNVINKSIEGK